MGVKRLDIPLGEDDFREVRDGGFYFVDKSELISDIVERHKRVFLFTRPRRFGKSLNLSMIDCFFNIRYRGNRWFDGLKVMEHPDAVGMMSSRPVMRIDMKDIPTETFDQFRMKLAVRIADLYLSFGYLKDSDIFEDEVMDRYMRGRSQRLNDAELQDSLRFLSGMLAAYHGVKPVVLVDEYDHPINDAFGKDSRGPILDFLRFFYSAIFKGNPDLGLAVITGVMQITRESIFSGLNNLQVNSILSRDTGGLDERYGFTGAEVQGLCRYYGRADGFDAAKEWYDGYRFGDAEIYNPWSVLSYIDSGFVPGTYWAGTSGNDIIDALVAGTADETYTELLKLGNGGQVDDKDVTAEVSLEDLLRKKDSIYSVLAVSGYLKAVPFGNGYSLSVPNMEMYSVFADIIAVDGIGSTAKQFRDFFDAAENHDVRAMEATAFSIFAENFQDWDLPDEGAYRRILAGAAMSRCGRYTVTSEAQSGNGRSDMIMRRNVPTIPNIVFEFKKSRSDDPAAWRREADEGIRQIKGRKYFHSLRGRTYLYGVCLYNKAAVVSFESMELRWPPFHVLPDEGVAEMEKAVPEHVVRRRASMPIIGAITLSHPVHQDPSGCLRSLRSSGRPSARNGPSESGGVLRGP